MPNPEHANQNAKRKWGQCSRLFFFLFRTFATAPAWCSLETPPLYRCAFSACILLEQPVRGRGARRRTRWKRKDTHDQGPRSPRPAAPRTTGCSTIVGANRMPLHVAPLAARGKLGCPERIAGRHQISQKSLLHFQVCFPGFSRVFGASLTRRVIREDDHVYHVPCSLQGLAEKLAASRPAPHKPTRQS